MDVNVARVLRRRFPAGVDVAADPWRIGQALMEFGQRICTARPRCGGCPVRAGCPGPTEADGERSATRRQKPFAGSVRQRRGRLLRRVLAEGSVVIGEDEREIAAGLAQDGLAELSAGRLRPPS
jgi:adenine-specific DNA glycosylase